MKPCKLTIGGLAAVSAFLALGARGAAPEISKTGGGLVSLKTGGVDIKLNGADKGGFSVYDAAKKTKIDLATASVAQSGGKTEFTAGKSGDMKLTATFSDKGRHILVTGELENLKGGERGIVLSYTLPSPGAGAVFANELTDVVKAGLAEIEGNVYPVAAMSGGGAAYAIAIPPTAPCEFGMTGSVRGLTVKMYLGISPETANFPNRAAFSFIIYPVDAAWGFRSAMEKYYSFYPEYYTNRLGVDGLYLFLAEDGKEPMPERIGQFASGTLETQAPWFKDYLKRDADNGILSFPYMIAGMREIKFLKTKPKDYDEAMAVYKKWNVKDHDGFPVTKEMEASGLDVNLRTQVDSSVCFLDDGKYALTIRYTPWGLNSVSFKTNPNPDLFKDTHDQSVGRESIRLIDKWLAQHPKLDGATIDSLGANWPAIFNYRKDHFKYARYPLTCDPDGRACLHNEISHYEFLETLREELLAKEAAAGKKLGITANGIYRYPARPEPAQHYNAGTAKKRTDIARFFLASQLDIAHSEPGLASPAKSLEFMRVSMGKKMYAPTNAHWFDAQKMGNWINKCLCYTLYGTNTRRYGDKIGYYFPDTWKRDRALFDWFVPLCRMLSKAGWEPVTHARAAGEKIIMERYGSGDVVYFVVMSEAAKEQKCVLDVDFAALGLDADDYEKGFAIEEVARKTSFEYQAPGKVVLTLKPYETCIVAVRRKG